VGVALVKPQFPPKAVCIKVTFVYKGNEFELIRQNFEINLQIVYETICCMLFSQADCSNAASCMCNLICQQLQQYDAACWFWNNSDLFKNIWLMVFYEFVFLARRKTSFLCLFQQKNFLLTYPGDTGKFLASKNASHHYFNAVESDTGTIDLQSWTDVTSSDVCCSK